MIRHAKPSEIEKILTLTQACANDMIVRGIYQWDEDYPSREAFLNDVKRGELFILLKENVIIGCIVISTYKDSEYDAIDWLTEDGNNYYIHRLAIHPQFQHKGHAKTLMDFAEALVQKNGGISVRLDTFSQNTRNQKFYKARGYQPTGTVYFPRQSDHAFYCYELIL